MAIYRCEARIIGREKCGRSVVAAAAYRTGTKLRDESRDRTFNYTPKGRNVIQSVILTPEQAPAWTRDSSQLWNSVEASEKRKDAQLAREFILALPHELDATQQFAAAVEWAQRELVSLGMVAEVSVHRPKKGKNYHAHVLCTLRPLEGEKFCGKKERLWNDVNLLLKQRAAWSTVINNALESAGRPERVDHRSLKDQGLDRLPEPKLGPEMKALKERGIDPVKYQKHRSVKLWNKIRPIAKFLFKNKFGGKKGFNRESLTPAPRPNASSDFSVRKVWHTFFGRHDSASNPSANFMNEKEKNPSDAVTNPKVIAIHRHVAARRAVTASTVQAAAHSHAGAALKKKAVDAIANVSALIKKAGLAKMTLGASVYLAKIREADRERQPASTRVPNSNPPRSRDRLGRGM